MVGYARTVMQALAEPFLLLLVLFLGPFGVYAYAQSRLQRTVPALLAGSALLAILILLTLLGAGP